MAIHPKEILNKMIDDFMVSSRALLHVTFRDLYQAQNDKAIYGKIYCKPSSRLATILNIEREIITVVTSFPEQQSRTLNAVKELIKESAGRLEKTVAIILHPDPRGNMKLRSWGREYGVSVIPILYTREKFPLSEIDFEKLLCKELFGGDPFDITGPVSDDSQFYGRRAEAQEIARKLQLGQIVSCLGIRKIGKTSILNRIINICKKHHECYSIMVDCSKDDIWKMDANTLLLAISRAIEVSIESDDRYATLETYGSGEVVVANKNKILELIMKSDLPLIIFFDEVDYITPSSPTTKAWISEFNIFWRNLRATYQEAVRCGKKFSIFISGVSSKWFCAESIDGIENSALTFIPEEYLGPLPRGASIAMVKNMARVSGLVFDEENADPIADTCGDVPFWIRKACSFIHRQIDIQRRPLRPTSEEIKSLLSEFVKGEGAILAHVALQHLFRVYEELKEISLKYLNNDINSCVPYYAGILKKYGVLREMRGDVHISGVMMYEGLRLYVEKKQDSQAPIANDEVEKAAQLQYDSVDEWAEELAVINRRRNIIERNLRSIVLDFIKFDSLQNKNEKPASERIFRRIPSERKKDLIRLPLRETMKQLFWLELCEIVENEWKLFEKMFIDKKQFHLNMLQINKRFDAHAKEDIDRLDVGLYRDSLKWFEDCLGR